MRPPLHFFVLVAAFMITIGGALGTHINSSIAEQNIWSPYEKLNFKSGDRFYQAEVIADLSVYLKEHGDDSKLLRVIDHDARTLIYILLNDTGEMFTGLQVVPSTALTRYSPLYKRMDW